MLEGRGTRVARCEILRMTLLKLNMSDSNTITVKRKVLGTYTRARKTHALAQCGEKLLRGPSVRSCTQRGGRGLVGFDGARRSLHPVVMRPRYCTAS